MHPSSTQMIRKVKQHGILCLICVPLITILFSCSSRKQDMKDIKVVWNNYTHALYRGAGTEAVQYIDSGSLHYYGDVLSLILHADSLTTEQLRFDQKILVLGVRLTAPAKLITRLDAHTLFIFCVRSRILSAKNDKNVFLNVLSLEDNTAKAQLVDSNKTPGLPLEFHKENGTWKVNLTTASSQFADNAWKSMVKQSGATDHDLLDAVLEVMSKRKPENRIWHPVIEAHS